jgi:hypothetical protein
VTAGELCGVWVRQDGVELLMRATPSYLVLDRWIAPKTRAIGRTKEPATWERVRDIPITDVASIEVDAIAAAGEHWDGWRFTTGMLHGSTKTPAITGILVTLKNGEHLLWHVVGKAPIEVRAELGPVMALLS